MIGEPRIVSHRPHCCHPGDADRLLEAVEDRRRAASAVPCVAAEKVAAFKAKVKAITRKTSPVNLEKVIADLNPILRGWANYFRMANCKGLYHELAGWIRRRLRAKQLALWKQPNRLIRRLRQVGVRGNLLKMRMTAWRTSRSSYASMAISNGYLAELGLFDIAELETGVLPEVT